MSFTRYNVVAIALLATSNAFAGETPRFDQKEARDQFERAATLNEARNYAEARTVLLKLWAQYKTYDVASELGRTAFHLGDMAASARYTAFALAHMPPHEQDPIVKLHERRLAKAAAKLQRLTVTCTPADAEFLIDGVALDVPIELGLFLTPGTHKITAKKAGYETVERDVEAAADTSGALSIELLKSPVGEPRSSAKPPASQAVPFDELPRATTASPPNPWLIAGGGVVTVGALVTALVFNSKANAAQKDAESRSDALEPGACVNPTGATSASCSALRGSADDSARYGAYATTGFVVTGVAAAGTLAYWLWPRQKSNSRTQGFVIDGTIGKNAGELRFATSF
jgi:hypothetical protein